MGSKICMNLSCRTTTTPRWKKGWPLKSGGHADLCYNCGSAFEKSMFCETFHLEEDGWRLCRFCNKRLHCGCIASQFLVEILEFGGIGCVSCVKNCQPGLVKKDETSGGYDSLMLSSSGDLLSSGVENRIMLKGVDEGRLSQLCKIAEAGELGFFSQSRLGDSNACLGKDKQLDVKHHLGEFVRGAENAIPSFGLFQKLLEPGSSGSVLDIGDMHESLSHSSLAMTLREPLAPRGSTLPFSNWMAKGREQSNDSTFQQLLQSHPVAIKPPVAGGAKLSEVSKSVAPPTRVARPPAEGRGKNHLLARYWPRITDQELQQLAGDLNSTIVPLFEKVLSASDAGRIGRLVLPKACAEAYFPTINHSEGVPIKIQDVKGKEWTFQFRFWPNNNSRMYVLEGVTPCIQSMQLQAGDTVTFSRIDPDGKLVMGFRKAANTEDQMDSGASSVTNGTSAGKASSSGVTENMTASAMPQPSRGGKFPRANGLPKHPSSGDADGCHENENHQGKMNGDSPQSVSKTVKKRTRNIGTKSKRLLMHREDAQELKLTWEEAQDLLRAPPSATPTIITVEDYEFEEYDEPPVFGKRTIFTQLEGAEQQWAQCDDCSKWRKLPVDVLLPPTWTCADNMWDTNRCSCSVPEEMRPKEAESRLRPFRDFKKQKVRESHKPDGECEPCGLDALASAAALGDNLVDAGDSTEVTTTKHPRHRAGCTCIVCIQPPSGKGKHKPSCICNVCLTVRRRFKTLMQRKKKRQSERGGEAEAETSTKEQNNPDEEPETDGTEQQTSQQNFPEHGHEHELSLSRDQALENHHPEHEHDVSQSRNQPDAAETSAAKIDLNSHPYRDDMQLEDPCVPRSSYEDSIKQDKTVGLASEQDATHDSASISPSNGHNENQSPDKVLPTSGNDAEASEESEKSGIQT